MRGASPVSRAVGRCAALTALMALTAALVGVGPVRAQVSGSVSLVSDYRFRGMSLSDGRPAAQATLSYDHPSGAYAGLFLSSVRFSAEAGSGLQTLAHAGYAARLDSGLSWDLGAAYSYYSNPRGYAYDEVHVGVAHTDWSARLSYAPRYFVDEVSAAYAQLSLTPHSERDFVPLLHIGFLRASAPAYYGPRSRWDGRIGLAYNHERLTLQLSWGSVSRAGGFGDERQDKSAWVLRLTHWL